MKRQLFAFIFAIIMAAVLNTYPVYAQAWQAIKADVPFAFTTNGTTLPAGTYRIEPIGDKRVVWMIRGTEAENGLFLLALNLTGSSQEDPRLEFHVYGDTHYLAGFTTASYEVALPVSKSEKKLRLARGRLATMHVAGIETVVGGSR